MIKCPYCFLFLIFSCSEQSNRKEERNHIEKREIKILELFQLREREGERESRIGEK